MRGGERGWLLHGSRAHKVQCRCSFIIVHSAVYSPVRQGMWNEIRELGAWQKHSH